MLKTRFKPLVIVVALALAVPALAGSREENRVATASDVVNQLARIPERSIPPALLSRAYAVAVIPNVVKVGFGVGARHGKGVIAVRQGDNSWSNPAFVTLTGGSFGWQIGAQSTDIILVFKSRRGVDGIESGKLTLGADASVAAGPVGRHTGLATDLRFQAEVFSYSRSRGLFAGVALEGAGVKMDHKSNAAYYSNPDITPDRIFAGSHGTAPDSAGAFVQTLTTQTQRLPRQPAMQAGPAPESPDEQPSEVRTYGMPGPEEEPAE